MERGMVRMQPVKLAARRQRLACVHHVMDMTYPSMPCEAARNRLLFSLNICVISLVTLNLKI